MPNPIFVVFFPFVASMLVSIGLGVDQLFFHRVKINQWLGIFMFSLAFDFGIYSLMLLGVPCVSPPIGTALVALAMQLSAAAFLIMIFLLTGHSAWLTRQVMALIFLPLILVALLVIWETAFAPASIERWFITASVVLSDLPFGPAGWLFYADLTGVAAVSIVLLTRKYARARFQVRKPLALSALGAGLLLLAAVLESANLNPIRPISLLQFALAISTSFILFGVLAWEPRSVLPSAYQTLGEQTRSGYLIIDQFSRIVASNEIARIILQLEVRPVIGQKLSAVWPEGANLLPENGSAVRAAVERTFVFHGAETPFAIQCIDVSGASQEAVGWVIQLHNLTDREHIEASLHQNIQKLARANAFLTTLAAIAVEMQTETDPGGIMEILGSELASLGLYCFIALLRPGSNELVAEHYTETPDTIRRLEKRIGRPLRGFPFNRDSYCLLYHIIDSGQVYFDPEGSVCMVSGGAGSGENNPEESVEKHSTLLIPLVTPQNTVGLMAVWGADLRAADSDLFRLFASQLSWTIERARLHAAEVQRVEALDHSNRMITALSRVASRLDSTSALPEVMETLGEELKEVNLSCMVGTLDAAKQEMKIEYLTMSDRLSQIAEKTGLPWPVELVIPRRLWPTEKAVTEKVPYWDPYPIGNAYKMFPFIPKDIFHRLMRMSGFNLKEPVCYLPLVNDENVIGVLGVWGAELRKEDIPALSVFATQVATAIKNTLLYRKAQEEIAERIVAEKRIREALMEKEVLLKEVHHRVKNNLQVISSLLSLQSAQVIDAKTLDALRESQNRVRTMALIHEKLYQSNDLAQINFTAYLHSLVTSLAQTYRVRVDKVAIQVEAEPIQLDLDTALPCGLMINELVSNSIKYAFPDDRPGKITVSCRQQTGQHYLLVVQDTGVGLPDGFDPAKSTSLGLKLVTSLVRQINGELLVDGSQGARFEINFGKR